MTTFRDFLKEQLATDPAFRAEWEARQPRRAISQAVIAARLAAGWTQRELADRLETKQSAIARLEQGDQDPRLSTLLKLARVLGTGFAITPAGTIEVRPSARPGRRGRPRSARPAPDGRDRSKPVVAGALDGGSTP